MRRFWYSAVATAVLCVGLVAGITSPAWSAPSTNKVFGIDASEIVLHAATLTDLRGMKGPDQQAVYLEGRSRREDGGQGMFRWDDSDLSTKVAADTQSGVYVAPDSDATGASGAWVRQVENDIVSVSAFGNDIQAALDSGYNVRLDSTSALTTSVTLTFAGHGQRLLGYSQYGSIITASRGLSGYILDTNSYSGIQIQNIKLDGNGTAKGLNVNNTYYSMLENVDVRNTITPAITLTNSNDNVINVVQSHNTSGDGWLIDATSQHNTFNSCGAEEFSGTGFDVNGIGNVFNGPWVENMGSATYASDVGLDINNRDNLVFAPEVRGAAAKPMSKGLVLGAYSEYCLIVNPHFSNVSTPMELLGTNLYRKFFGVAYSDITNTGGDTTTLLQAGNHIYSDTTWSSPAPTLNFESTNGTSGVRYNLEGTATSNHYRWQVGGSTIWEISANDDLLPGSDDTRNVGAITKRVKNVNAAGYLSVGDGISAPDAVPGTAFLYVDGADGALKVRFGDGTVKTLTTNP